MSLENLSPQQRRAILALLSGANYVEAADAAGVNRNTLYRWRQKDNAFNKVLAEEATRAVRDAASALSANVHMVALVPQAVALDEEEAASVRLRATDMILSHLPRLVEMTQLLERLDAVERALNVQGRAT